MEGNNTVPVKVELDGGTHCHCQWKVIRALPAFVQ